MISALQVVLLAMLLYMFPRHSGLTALYDRLAFYPFQSLRVMVFRFVPISIGDVLYILGGTCLLVTFCRWLYCLVRFGSHKLKLAASLLNTVNAVLFVYLFFLLGWGANYYKQPLGKSLGLFLAYDSSKANRRKADSTTLIAFNEFLVGQLNACAPGYHYRSLREVNSSAGKYYSACTDSKVKAYGLGIKPSLFGYFLERMAIQGYYNPFTGEGQINADLPCFLLPFVVCHEMAHQAGIAAEGDANLMAYALCTASGDSLFRYSGYICLWEYANGRLFRRDSAVANGFEARLNKLTRAHLDTLDQLSRKYDNGIARYGTDLYDDYLKMQHQHEGIKSYGNVISSAWQLEVNRSAGIRSIIHVP